jgi:hypothetical protein
MDGDVKKGDSDEEIEIMSPERCLRMTGRTARVTIGFSG